MKETRFFYCPDAAQSHCLPDEEAQHAVRVLRLKEGDEIMLMDGKGVYYQAIITLASNKKCMYDIQQAMPQQRQWHNHITLSIAPTKLMDRMEWMCEKITEMGIDEIRFLCTRYSERKVIKLPRIEKIVVSAVKQSHKAWLPDIADMTSIDEFLNEPRQGVKLIAHCHDTIERRSAKEIMANAPKGSPITILIGPEGDFSEEEVRNAMLQGSIPVSLGESRLRTETAGMYAVAMAHIASR